jgi:hypothetical protein
LLLLIFLIFYDYSDECANRRCCIVAPPLLFMWEKTQLFSQHYEETKKSVHCDVSENSLL